MKVIQIKVSDDLYRHLTYVSTTQQLTLSALVRSTLAKHTKFEPKQTTKASDLSLDDIEFDEE
jgi:hypothetical protein